MLLKRYKVKYTVNGEIFEENFSCMSEKDDERLIEAEINGELDDRFYGENREIKDFKRIKTPEEMKINGLEEYYKREEKNI